MGERRRGVRVCAHAGPAVDRRAPFGGIRACAQGLAVMMTFNLLQYPALARKRRRLHSRWTAVSGVVLGSVVAMWLLAQVEARREKLLQELALLEFHWKQDQSRLAADKVWQAQQNIWQQQVARVQALSAEQQRWTALHQALLTEAGPESVQFNRLQLDAQTLELQGITQDVQRMDRARARLSTPLAPLARDTAWTLVSVVNSSELNAHDLPVKLEFVWQTTWPQWGVGLVPGTSAHNPQLADSVKVRP